jgi:hypothetical protein
LTPALQVNYVGKAANLYEDAGYKLHGSSYVIDKYLGTSYLWNTVRTDGHPTVCVHAVRVALVVNSTVAHNARKQRHTPQCRAHVGRVAALVANPYVRDHDQSWS